MTTDQLKIINTTQAQAPAPDPKTQYPKEQVTFLQTLYDMRMAQAAFFKQPSDYRKKMAIALECKVDSLLQPYIKAGVVTPKVTPVNPKNELFK